MSNSVTPHQNAIRLLFILIYGSEKLPNDHYSGAEGVFKSEMRLHAMDFWVRYPDYLAHELICIFKKTNDFALIKQAEAIFEDQEPDLRRIPMIRYRFGAYDKVDNTLSVLISKGLIRQEDKKNITGVQEHHYLLMPSAYSLESNIEQEFPVLGWYKERAKLVSKVAGNRGGKALKDRQYDHITYANTTGGSIIQSITEEVRLNLQNLRNRI